MKKKIVHILLNYLLRKHFNALTEEDVFITDRKNGIIQYKGKPLKQEFKERISNDAELIQGSILWKLLKNEAEYQANTKMFKTSGNKMDMLFGKAMLHTIKVLDTRIKQLSHLQ